MSRFRFDGSGGAGFRQKARGTLTTQWVLTRRNVITMEMSFFADAGLLLLLNDGRSRLPQSEGGAATAADAARQG